MTTKPVLTENAVSTQAGEQVPERMFEVGALVRRLRERAITSPDGRVAESDATIAADLIEHLIGKQLGMMLVPIEPTDEMISRGCAATNSFLNIPGSGLTVKREKMRLRYKAMIGAA